MPRIWFSGPRILFGLVRPGISFSLAELQKKKSSQHHAGAPLPDEQQAPAAEDPPWARIAAWVVWAFAIWGFLSMVGCMIVVANAGTCRIYGEGTDTVEACDDGSFSVTDRHGHQGACTMPFMIREATPGDSQ
jgi:hypothetical protein